MGTKGLVWSAAAMGVLLHEGIGDTIRVSLTPRPGGDRREEVYAACELLQSLGLRSFAPSITACPGCGRTTSTGFQELAERIQSYVREQMPAWKTRYEGVETMTLAVMGCIVNGPGESKAANIGISLPGTGEAPSCPVYIDGQKFTTLKGTHEELAEAFRRLGDGYVGPDKAKKAGDVASPGLPLAPQVVRAGGEPLLPEVRLERLRDRELLGVVEGVDGDGGARHVERHGGEREQEVAGLLGWRVRGVLEVHDRAVVPAEQLVDVAEDLRETHLDAPGKALARAYRGEEFPPRRSRRHREDGGDGRIRMGVRSADERERAALLLGRGEKVLDERVVLVGHRAVLHLEDVEKLEHRREEVLRSLPHAVRLEEVVRGIEQSLAPQVLDEVEDVAPL